MRFRCSATASTSPPNSPPSFEALGWYINGQRFIFNLERLQIIILQMSVVGIIAVGVNMVIITSGIDLSSGSVVTATAVVPTRSASFW
jgi:ribose/xylose/arabinose/galactoside ABC-type transport system permease subunit